MRCPACKSYTDHSAAFCSQCGRQIGRRSRAAGVGLRLLSVVLLLLALLAVLAVLYEPESGVPAAGFEAARAPEVAAARRPAAEEAPAADAHTLLVRPEDDELQPLDGADLARRLREALVVLDLRAENGRPLREERGVIVDATGVVLTRYHSLLGAHGGVCRLSDSRESRVEIVGVSYREAVSDLALVRIKRSASGYPMVAIRPGVTPPFVDRGEPLYVLGGGEVFDAEVSDPFHLSDDGFARARLARSPAIPADAFLAADVFGFLVGLCRPEVDGRPLRAGRPLESREFRVIVDPVASVRNALVFDAQLSLHDLTRREYEGTFADLFARGTIAFQQGRWREAVEVLEQATGRARLDLPDDEDFDSVLRMLRESYLEETRRLVDGGRLEEAALLARAAAERFGEDAAVLARLGEVSMERGEWLAAVEAFRQARAIEAVPALDAILEQGYLRLAAESARANDLRAQESNLLSGIRDLPNSGQLVMELAALYANLGAYNDAIGLLERAKEISPSLTADADRLLSRIDDILKRREAVIIPLDPNSRAIRATILIDGVRELSAIIDTGATYTALPERILRELRYDLNDHRKWSQTAINTAAGPMVVRRGLVQSVNIGGSRGFAIRNLEVLALPQPVGDEFGLLGLNFLNHFRTTHDSSRQEFRIERP